MAKDRNAEVAKLDGNLAASQSLIESLSDEEQARILADEVYRRQIRKALDAKDDQKRSGGKKAWAFLNSAFGVMIFASFIATIFTWGLTRYDHVLAKKEDANKAVAAINAEIAYRVDFATENYATLTSIFRPQIFLGPSNKVISGGKDEAFENDSTKQLLRRLPTPESGHTQAEIDGALKALDDLMRLMDEDNIASRNGSQSSSQNQSQGTETPSTTSATSDETESGFSGGGFGGGFGGGGFGMPQVVVSVEEQNRRVKMIRDAFWPWLKRS